MKHDFSGIDSFKDWRQKQGKRFRSFSPRAIGRQNKKYESEYYWPIIKERNIPILTARFYLVYGSTSTIDNLIPTSSMLSFVAAAETLASQFQDGDTIDGVTLATGDRIIIKAPK